MLHFSPHMEEEAVPMHSPVEHIIGDGIIDSHLSGSSSNSDKWRFAGSTFPKSELVYLSQVLLIYIVVCTCLYSLVSAKGDSNLWSALLSGEYDYNFTVHYIIKQTLF
jgi:hypothetical protein